MREGEVVADRYALTEVLGHGGTGEVWAGRDQRLHRRVAVKFLMPRQNGRPVPLDRNTVQRFVREARVTAMLEHPGVPTLYDAGTHGDALYMVMQLVRGTTIADILSTHGPMPISWAAAVGAQVCLVLARAHAESLVHRDLKPQNLMMTPDGTVKVLDFGIAIAADPEAARLTATGLVPGTPGYIPPEQVRGATAGPSGDLYALGCVLYELLTGRPPFHGRTPVQVIMAHLHDVPEPVARHRPDVPQPLADLVDRLLAKEPLQRPENAAEVHALLVPWAVDRPEAGPAQGWGAPPAATPVVRPSSPAPWQSVGHGGVPASTGPTTAPAGGAAHHHVAAAPGGLAVPPAPAAAAPGPALPPPTGRPLYQAGVPAGSPPLPGTPSAGAAVPERPRTGRHAADWSTPYGGGAVPDPTNPWTNPFGIPVIRPDAAPPGSLPPVPGTPPAPPPPASGDPDATEVLPRASSMFQDFREAPRHGTDPRHWRG
ncbi:serine/threonine-protein kinase [Allostreptomyces psammosilenae]|uniref:non-specific serine/threonine protein kinase n=1 Tax=Allostreptomyces psammosilenae TaxID=1892865 RepID=A0A852ZU17_9ACTN|nr:serine/threonine-protein kinase [Allostreptomyces psammosilenae]NYI05057.1 hypothetical protein [Allostreptomyces psammosilenae]